MSDKKHIPGGLDGRAERKRKDQAKKDKRPQDKRPGESGGVQVRPGGSSGPIIK